MRISLLLLACALVLLCSSSFLRSFAFDTHPSLPLGSSVPTSISFDKYLEISIVPPTGVNASTSTHLTVLHLNDLYELIPSGSKGGVARVAMVLNILRNINQNTISVLAGDLFSPSALSSVPIRERGNTSFDGAQMVASMNAMGLNFSTLGNHETDVKQNVFAQHLHNSNFPWLCVNALNQSYEHLTNHSIIHIPNVNPNQAKTKPNIDIGIWGMTLDSNNKDYESYLDFTSSLPVAANEVQGLLKQTDVILALTHLPYWHDETLRQTVSGIDIILGGHEHKRLEFLDPVLPPIYKADSNVNSVWIHDMYIDTTLPRGNPGRVIISSYLVDIDSSIADDPYVANVVNTWVNQAFEGFEAAGFQPRQFLAQPTDDLVGTNEVIFQADTKLTELFNAALFEECIKYNSSQFIAPTIDATLFNAGAIRIDDTIPAGTNMTQYDAIRISPYLNSVWIVNITGALLKKTLDTSFSKMNNSQFLHFSSTITVDSSSPTGYMINNAPLQDATDVWYTVGLLQFLLQGKAPYGFLLPSATNTQLQVIAGDSSGKSDVRRSLIDQIAKAYPPITPPGPSPPAPWIPSDNPTTILGMRVWICVFLAVGVVVVLCAVAGYCLRMRRRNGRRGRSNSTKYFQHPDYLNDQRAFLDASDAPYSVQRDRDV